MRRSLLLALPTLALVAVSGCGGGGGGGHGSRTSAQPAYVNHTATGQCGNNDLGFHLGADSDPESPSAGTPNPKLTWDLMNGYSTMKTDIGWRVLKDGAPFASGTITSMTAFTWVDLSVDITPGAGTHTYRIEIDPANAFSETNENNNWVEVTVSIPSSAAG